VNALASALLPASPTVQERDSYAQRSLPYLALGLLASSVCVTIAQVLMEVRNAALLPWAVGLFGAYTLLYATYQAISIPVNFAGASFDLGAHKTTVGAWLPDCYPSVDILLPICGEPLEVLRNTWTGVFELLHAYPGVAHAFVLDDGDSAEAMVLSADFGFGYGRRSQHVHKKAGNLNYGLRNTHGEHVVIFDADFRPRPDFLAETLPYMDDPSVGIVQTPQFFRVSPDQTWIERAAGATLEIFYRAVQVSRDRFGSALCVGSNAVYRRSALEAQGGFTLIPYAEDSHTGLDLRHHGYELRYLPLPLAAGVCPARMDPFMRQQYRWCCGATSLIFTRHMWRVRMPLVARLPYIAGWLWNLTTGLRTLLLPLIPIVLLACVPGEIRLRNAILLLPAVLTGMLVYPLWHNARWTSGVWPLAVAVGWAQALALWDYGRGKVMSWQPSRGPGDATRRFRFCVVAWNGTLAVLWLVLAGWRIWQTGSLRFGVVAAFGLLNAIVVARVIFPGKDAS
jgi:cellulose synthase (UDP-forming)